MLTILDETGLSAKGETVLQKTSPPLTPRDLQPSAVSASTLPPAINPPSGVTLPKHRPVRHMPRTITLVQCSSFFIRTEEEERGLSFLFISVLESFHTKIHQDPVISYRLSSNSEPLSHHSPFEILISSLPVRPHIKLHYILLHTTLPTGLVQQLLRGSCSHHLTISLYCTLQLTQQR